jgi:hypothetical protein
MSPKMLQSPEEYPSETIPVEKQNGDKQLARISPDASVKIRRDFPHRPNEALLKAAKVGDLKTV